MANREEAIDVDSDDESVIDLCSDEASLSSTESSSLDSNDGVQFIFDSDAEDDWTIKYVIPIFDHDYDDCDGSGVTALSECSWVNRIMVRHQRRKR